MAVDYKKICTQTCEAAKKAGEYIASQRESFSFSDVEFKGAHNLVSYVDKQAEEMIVASLRKILPEAGFITEEGTAVSAGEKYKWIVDPLDGTTNFVHGLPPYCVSIALMEGHEIVVGVVYEVVLKEMFHAWKGSDAYLNGKQCKVSSVGKMEHALIAIGFSYAALEGMPGFLDTLASYQKNTDGIRRIGSATADLVYVACGRVDAFCQIYLAPWDVAAGAFIAQRAGAIVSDNSGGGDFIFGKEIVAATPAIYGEFMKTIIPVK